MSLPTTTATTLGQHARVEGDLHIQQHAIIAGHVTGHLTVSGRLELAESAIVDGNVSAESITLAGSVKGNLLAHDSAHLRPGCQLAGQLITRRLTIDPGTAFNGNIRIVPDGALESTQDSTDFQSDPTVAQPAEKENLQPSSATGQLNLSVRNQRRRRQRVPIPVY